ncbi:MAG: hypothetical protein AABX29_04195 [Nanoarchaeota archaeon]
MIPTLETLDKLPKDKLNLLSQYEREKAKFWFYAMHQGKSYVIPVDKEMYKIIKKVGLWNFENVINNIIGAIYLQARQAVGDGIEMMLSQQIDDGFRKLYSPKLRARIESQFNLLEFKPSESTTPSKDG